MPIFSAPKKQVNALCLGGGGARGFAHIGAIKAFEEEGIKFDIVAGASVGSLIGGLYAAGISVSRMEEFGDELTLREVHFGFTPNDPLKIGNVIKKLVGDIRIEELRIPYYAVAVDLVAAKQVIFDKGPLYEAVSASSAVPIFFRPLIKNKLHLVDGGLLNNIPADVCRMMGATNVVTVDINPTRGGGTEGVGIIDVAKATLSIMTAGSSVQGLIDSDVIIAPDLSAFRSTKKDGHTDMIRLGYEAAKEKMSAIKELFGIKEKKVKEPETASALKARKKREREAAKAAKAQQKKELKAQKLAEKEKRKGQGQ